MIAYLLGFMYTSTLAWLDAREDDVSGTTLLLACIGSGIIWPVALAMRAHQK